MIITITRVEGPTEQCGKAFNLLTFTQANALLRCWALSAPTSGYDKCDFKIANEETGDVFYSGRYDLKHWTIETANLQQHIIATLEYHIENGSELSDTRALVELFKGQK